MCIIDDGSSIAPHAINTTMLVYLGSRYTVKSRPSKSLLANFVVERLDDSALFLKDSSCLVVALLHLVATQAMRSVQDLIEAPPVVIDTQVACSILPTTGGGDCGDVS